MKKTIFLISIGFYLTLASCNSINQKDKTIDKSIEVELDNVEKGITQIEKKSEDIIFYNMFSPVDLQKIVDTKTSYYNSAYVNSISNITRYTSSQKIALNTGVYGADLSYLWMFDQTQQALSYLSAIQHLTSKLGIPDSFVQATFKLAESNADQQDSLINIVKNAYADTDIFLKESNRESAAVFILLGGWIETLNIAVNMYNEPNSKFAAKIISQKYSLNSLITMVQNTQDDIVMTEYLLLLKKLQSAFNAIEVNLKPEDIEIDTIKKQITIKDSDNLIIQPEQLKEVKAIAAKIRSHIVS